MLMHKKGQTGFGALISYLLLGLVWLLGFTEWISNVGQVSIQQGGLTGAEAFFYANFNLWIGIFYIIGLYLVGKYAV